MLLAMVLVVVCGTAAGGDGTEIGIHYKSVKLLANKHFLRYQCVLVDRLLVDDLAFCWCVCVWPCVV